MQTQAMTLEDCGLPLPVSGGQDLSRQANLERRIELERLLSKNLPRFRRLAMRWLRNPEDAEDAVQDAVLSAFKNVSQFEGRAQMSTWLFAADRRQGRGRLCFVMRAQMPIAGRGLNGSTLGPCGHITRLQNVHSLFR